MTDFSQYGPQGAPVSSWVQVSRVPAAKLCVRCFEKVRGKGWFHPKSGQYLCRECKEVNDAVAEGR